MSIITGEKILWTSHFLFFEEKVKSKGEEKGEKGKGGNINSLAVVLVGRLVRR